MKITTESTEILEWDFDSSHAKAIIESENQDHKFIRFSVDKEGMPLEKSVFIETEDLLRDVYKAMGDLIRHLDKKRDVGSVDNSTTNTVNLSLEDISKMPSTNTGKNEQFWVEEMRG